LKRITTIFTLPTTRLVFWNASNVLHREKIGLEIENAPVVSSKSGSRKTTMSFKAIHKPNRLMRHVDETDKVLGFSHFNEKVQSNLPNNDSN
jgi:hypothetical protein